MNTMPSDKESFDDDKIDPIRNSSIDSTRTTELSPGLGIYPKPCRSLKLLATSEVTSEKASQHNKNLDPIVKDNANFTKSLFPSLSLYVRAHIWECLILHQLCTEKIIASPSTLSSTGVTTPIISETNSTSPSSSSSTGVTTVAMGTKTSDAKSSDSYTNPSQGSCNST